MPPQYEYQLFELERLESGLVRILSEQGLPTQGKYTRDTNITPRVELQLTIVRSEGHRHRRNPTNGNSFAQPFDSWIYSLSATIATNRTTNGDQHIPLIGRTRYALQYFRLIETLTKAVSPYHTLTSIAESGQQDSVEDEGNLQLTQITFEGVMNIRADAWAA